MSSNDVALSVYELMRAVSAITSKEVSSDVFSKADKTCEALWQLLIVYFDMPIKPFRPSHLYVLLNRVVEELRFPQPFYISDFEEPLDRRKLMGIFSSIVRFIQFKINLKKDCQIYNSVLARKTAYAELCEAVLQHQDKVSSKRTGMRAKQERIEQLSLQVDEATALSKEYESKWSVLDNRQAVLNESTIRSSEQIEVLQKENEKLESDKNVTQKEVLQNVDTLPESIGMVKDRLNQIEADMHSLFEKRTSLIERGAVYEHCESLLAQLQDCVDKTYSLLEKDKDIRRQEKLKLKERNKVMTESDKYRSERDDLSRRLTEHQNHVVRQRLLLANKKKTLQTKKKNTAKELEAIKEETKQHQKSLHHEQQKLRLLESQLNHMQGDMEKVDHDRTIIDELCRLLTDLQHTVDRLTK